MKIDPFFQLTLDEPEMDALLEIMDSAVSAGILSGLPLAIARAFVDAADEADEEFSEPVAREMLQ